MARMRAVWSGLTAGANEIAFGSVRSGTGSATRFDSKPRGDTMFKHILVPSDFGEPAEHALEIASELAAKFGSKVSVLHVYQVFLPMPYWDGFAWPVEEIALRARTMLDAYLAKAKQRHPGCEGILRPGVASDQIVTVAGESGVDLVVMGTHGRRGVPRLVLGSTAERVVRTSPVPVLTVSAKGEPTAVPATQR
jgi:nucleotide-binding universal stress UspA family protein